MSHHVMPWFAQPLHQFASRDLSSTDLPPVSGGQHHDPDALYEIFHETTKYHRNTMAGIGRTISAFLSDPALIERGAAGRRVLEGFEQVPLPDARKLDGGLEAALQGRRSAARGSMDGRLSLIELSTIMHHALRVNMFRSPDRAPHIRQGCRPYPSGGALFPCEFYVAHPGEGDVASFVAHYDPVQHALRRMPGVTAEAVRAAETQDLDECSPCAILVTSVFQRSIQKYGSRGYRLALIEAGHALQNILLVATALNLKCLVSASFYESEIEQAIGADGVSEGALAMALISN